MFLGEIFEIQTQTINGIYFHLLKEHCHFSEPDNRAIPKQAQKVRCGCVQVFCQKFQFQESWLCFVYDVGYRMVPGHIP